MKKTIYQDGKIYHQTYNGKYEAEKTILGNPKMNLDIFGKPVIKTDMLGKQIVERDMLGKPIIPVAFPTKSSIGAQTGVSDSSTGVDAFFTLLPIVLLAGGLYSVFATMAGEAILFISILGIIGMWVATLIADKSMYTQISNGIQPAFYIITTGWIFGIVRFWIEFFYNMNFDVSNTNYLTWQDMISSLFPKMGKWACVGIVFSILFSFFFRSDMYAIRKKSSKRNNTSCVIDMLAICFIPPISAVVISLAWCIIVSPIIAIFTDYKYGYLIDQQATVMMFAFVLIGVVIFYNRSKTMVKG